MAFVNKERMRQPRIGTRKLHYLLAQHELYIGRDHLFLLLKALRLLVPARRACHRTTNSRHRFYCHSNELKDGLVPSHPEQLWVADITYFPAHQGEAYISLVTDAYSRKIAGYQVDDTMATRSVKQAFVRALKGRQRETTLVHHSDRGSQYCSSEYQALHQKYGVICSMTDGYDCYQNALAERVNGILKQEYLLVKPALFPNPSSVKNTPNKAITIVSGIPSPVSLFNAFIMA
ncbi:IS3 family transposase [Vibrio mimicus]